ncbi:hypothetical protein Pint_16366 [Pistacia integerrima]|uniref:Uncharacterized protein n=1 Tax=Pistacia integerrima TaxID=434235 RepID=A0ACC0ZEA4_9ROSI|nr:hypothetical protein Pint_16366 [Pistacia integerrima]
MICDGTPDTSTIFNEHFVDLRPDDHTTLAPKISLHAFADQQSPRTLRLTSQLLHSHLQILIDSDSTHNFIQPCIADYLHLPVDIFVSFLVTVGNGDTIFCLGKCFVQLNLSDHMFDFTLYVLPIYGVDVVLGVDWLHGLGPVTFDYSSMTLSFRQSTQIISLHGTKPTTPAAIAAFALKLALTTTPILHLSDFTTLFILETDASGVALGAVFSQHGHPIAHYNKVFSPQMHSSSTYVKEMTAITASVHKWRHYLLGHEFIIRTNHRALQHLLMQSIQTLDQQCYLQKLLGF